MQPRQKSEITLENAWPDDDGNQWIYDVRLSEPADGPAVPRFATPEEVPAMPSLDEIEAQLPDLSRPGGPLEQQMYRLRFNGLGQSSTGAEGKRLESRYGDDVWMPKGGMDPLLARLASYRPELLQGKLEDFEPVGYFAPLFVRNGIWTRTSKFIAFFNDVDLEARYRILEDDLSVGHEWSVATTPGLGHNVILHARVMGETQRAADPFPATTHSNSVRVLYALDLGVHAGHDEPGNLLGYVRAIVYGVVEYEADVGPIFFREFVFVYLDKDLDGNTVFLDPLTEYEGWLSD